MEQTDGRKVTLEEMQKGLNTAIRNGISPAAAVLWADNVCENDGYCREMGAVPGSVILGLEWIEDHQVIRGTLQLQPSKLSETVS